MKLFGFIVITNAYAGNFEREMSAYMTGYVGECEVGKEYIEDDKKNELNKLFGNTYMLADDSGCHRLVSTLANDYYFTIPITENEKHNAFVIYFAEMPTKEQIDVLKTRALEFPEVWGKRKPKLEVLNFMIVERQTKITKI